MSLTRSGRQDSPKGEPPPGGVYAKRERKSWKLLILALRRPFPGIERTDFCYKIQDARGGEEAGRAKPPKLNRGDLIGHCGLYEHSAGQKNQGVAALGWTCTAERF